MKNALCYVILGMLMIGQITAGQISSETEQENEKAIRKIVENWTIGWNSRDSKLVMDGFAEDVDWMNAFGVKKKGREELKAFLDWVFSLDNSKERENSEVITLIRFIRPDVALVYADFFVKKQRYLTGEEMADRKGHNLRVMVKGKDQWQIASMLIMDEKSTEHLSSDIGWESKKQCTP